MLDWNTLLNSMITGLFVGAESTIGTWLITRHFLRNLERLEEKIRTGNNPKKEGLEHAKSRNFEKEKRDYESKIVYLIRKYLAIIKKEQKWRKNEYGKTKRK